MLINAQPSVLQEKYKPGIVAGLARFPCPVSNSNAKPRIVELEEEAHTPAAGSGQPAPWDPAQPRQPRGPQARKADGAPRRGGISPSHTPFWRQFFSSVPLYVYVSYTPTCDKVSKKHK